MPKASHSFFLIGPRCSGKTTVGRLLARELRLPFYDTDAMVAAEAGRSISELVSELGWQDFREREARALREASAEKLLPDHPSSGRVIATGGGMILSADNREHMRASGLVLYLALPLEQQRERMAGQARADHRPSLSGLPPLEELAGIFSEREALYLQCAHHSLDAQAAPLDIVRSIVRLAGDLPPETGVAHAREFV